MKKIFLSLSLLIAIAFNSNAQLTGGTLAPDFTATDINGNSINLYSVLDSGYTVFLDISAAWCSPCWNYHTGVTNGTGGVPALEGLYSQYGPSGTDEVRVYYIEGESTNTTAQLYGTSSGTAHSTFSQGDWVTGTAYPIIDNATVANSYQISYFPTIYMICPDRVVVENGQLTTAQHYAAKQAGCYSAVAGLDAGITTSPDLFGNFYGCNGPGPVDFRIGNYGSTPLTSATISYTINGGAPQTQAWTGNLATYETALVTITPTGGASGDNTLAVTITSPNGGADINSSNDSKTLTYYVYPTAGATSITEGFESSTAPAHWFTFDPDQDGTAWFSFYNTAQTYGGYGSSAGGAALEMYYSPSGNIDDYKAPAASFVGMNHPLLKFDVAYAEYSDGTTTYKDRLKVKVSTDCGATWTTKLDEQGDALMTGGVATTYFLPTASTWKTEYIDLSSLSGQQQVLIEFEGISGYGNNVFIDNVNIVSGSAAPTVNNIVNAMNVYPNPANDNATVEFSLGEISTVTVSVVNTLGQVVMVKNLGQLASGEFTTNLDLNELTAGIYKVTVQSGNQTQTQKLSVIR